MNNLGTVRKLNSVLFPVRYSEPFYKTILQLELEEYCRLSECLVVCSGDFVEVVLLTIAVYFNDIPVGTTCSRIEKGSQDGEAKLYMMTMGVLAVRRTSFASFRNGRQRPTILSIFETESSILRWVSNLAISKPEGGFLCVGGGHCRCSINSTARVEAN